MEVTARQYVELQVWMTPRRVRHRDAERAIVPAKASYRDNARRVAEAMSKADPLHTLDDILEHLNGRLDR
jgi:hypothetical protein